MYIDSGNRYIYYPETEDCCYCCNSANGCGMLKPDWMQTAEFLGEINFDGVLAYKWNMKGVEDNILVETAVSNPKERKLLLIDQHPQDYTHFYQESFTPFVHEEDIALPKSCSPSKYCSYLSLCTLFRWF
mmetsp:Transcript_42777/g.50154  ORF Transcript_42777/g.50154 Transcript_42777/m.50154 type:complete len:130 (-) Transcript_42777:53-442(-)